MSWYTSIAGCVARPYFPQMCESGAERFQNQMLNFLTEADPRISRGIRHILKETYSKRLPANSVHPNQMHQQTPNRLSPKGIVSSEIPTAMQTLGKAGVFRICSSKCKDRASLLYVFRNWTLWVAQRNAYTAEFLVSVIFTFGLLGLRSFARFSRVFAKEVSPETWKVGTISVLSSVCVLYIYVYRFSFFSKYCNSFNTHVGKV